jgi:FAD:protein FMN transferase
MPGDPRLISRRRVLHALLVGPSLVPPIRRSRGLSRHEFSEPHMGTTLRLVLYAGNESTAHPAAEAAFARVAALDRALSDYRPDSELSRLSETAGRWVRVSSDLFTLLEHSQDLAARTGGAFDVTVGPLTRLWRRARRQGQLPPADEVAEAREVTGFRLLDLDPTASAVRLTRPGMRLDLGGIAKGYAADRALAEIRRAGSAHALVAVGGDLAMGSRPPDSSGWRVVLAGLDADRPAPGGNLTVSDSGVSTSGDAEQWVEISGTRYSHILDPRTGLPLTGRRSVTIVAQDATTSDMLATAVSVLGPADGLPLVDRIPGVRALIGVRSPAGDTWRTSRSW